jgi:penicillin amidase
MSKRLTVLTAVLGSAIGAAGALYYALLRRPLAQTKGSINLPGLQDRVQVIRDRWGVPHIYAGTSQDLFFAQGFVHAQDRFFQMEFSRRLVAGRLAEVVGPPAVAADRWLRVLGLRRVAEKEAPLLQAETRELLLAYASGVNAYVDRGKLPLEFKLLRYSPERWQIADSLAWIKFMDWTLSVNWEAEILRAQLVAQLGPERAALLDGPYPPQNPTTLPEGVDWSHVGSGALLRADAARPYTGPPTEAGLGSNNWVVDGSRTASGAPLLANDPHLSLNLPSIWYENHLCGADYDVVGLSMPGMPSIVVGHNGRVAWGLTAGFPDTQDLYLERLNPDSPSPQYEFEGAWHDAEVIREEIVVKGAEPVIEQVVITRHGPLIDGLLPDATSQPLALRWPALDPQDMAGLLLDYCRARTCDEFHQELRRWAGPSQNVVYADVEGNIGYTLVGLMPVRAEGHDGSVPVPGWTGEHEWQGYVPFEEWPHAINPPGGLLITANGKPVGDDYPYFLGNCWLPGFRAARISELLQDARELTLDDFCRMQFDQKSVLARRVGQYLGRLQHASPIANYALTLFRDWDGDLAPGSAAAAIYQVLIRRVLYNLFDDLLGDSPLADWFVGQGPHPLLAATSGYGPNGRMLLWRLLDEPHRPSVPMGDSPLLEKRSLDELMLHSLSEAV